MAYSVSYQLTHDIDWFAIHGRYLVHFASNGGLIPKDVKVRPNCQLRELLFNSNMIRPVETTVNHSFVAEWLTFKSYVLYRLWEFNNRELLSFNQHSNENIQKDAINIQPELEQELSRSLDDGFGKFHDENIKQYIQAFQKVATCGLISNDRITFGNEDLDSIFSNKMQRIRRKYAIQHDTWFTEWDEFADYQVIASPQNREEATIDSLFERCTNNAVREKLNKIMLQLPLIE